MYSRLAASGVVIEDSGVDSSSRYQNFREVPSGAYLECPSLRATSLASVSPRVGRPTMTSGENGATFAARSAAIASTTTKLAWLRISEASACSPLASGRIGNKSTRPSSKRAGWALPARVGALAGGSMRCQNSCELHFSSGVA